ncbi:hypothetical protein [Glycomyces dulcitolivorans]|uniref:hypothetical protein n=1 Tax=Glycomyces dulcitolivorans TaxID=2200759 RepID=UPI000DD38218|nr:hypothetical protein [Glycomyces dulcitolivorans]
MTEHDDAPPDPVPSRRGPSRRLVALVAAGAVALAAAGVTSWALWPDAVDDPYPDVPEGVYHAADVRAFDDLAVMTASSALVVKGTAVEIRPGAEVVYDDGSEAAVTDREVVVDVDKVVYDRYGIGAPETVVVVEGYWENGIGYTREGMPWTEVGQSGYFYLTAPPPDVLATETYAYIHEAGRVLIGSGSAVSIPGHWQEEGPWTAVDHVNGGAPAFETAIQSAADAAAAGEAVPELISVCVPSDPAVEDSAPLCWEE